jgi:hypothetical protein
MITVISDENEIVILNARFQNRLYQHYIERINCRVGYPGGSFQGDVYYSPASNLWFGHLDNVNSFWNGFGHGEPIDWNSNSISAEINFPKVGINRRIGGVFARDDDGNILVLHRGKIGGGKAGIGKRFFMDHFSGDFVTAIDGDRETRFCLVGDLFTNDFHDQIASFIESVRSVKSLISSGLVNLPALTDFVYTDEQSGVSITERNEPIVINRVHGIIVNALSRELIAMGHKVGNDKNRDLFIYKDDRIKVLFEIKTSSSTQCLYSAIGQLLLYSVPISKPVKLVAVLPEKLSQAVENRFAELGIKIIYYSRHDDIIVFQEIDNILRR